MYKWKQTPKYGMLYLYCKFVTVFRPRVKMGIRKWGKAWFYYTVGASSVGTATFSLWFIIHSSEKKRD